MKNEFNNAEYKKMQEILPDYALGNAEPEDKAFFEQNLAKYPDLEEEVRQAENVFNRLNNMDFDSVIRERTRNLSVKVNSKLDRRTEAQKKVSFFGRIVMPTVGVVVVLFFVMLWNPADDNINISNPPVVSEQIDENAIIEDKQKAVEEQNDATSAIEPRLEIASDNKTVINKQPESEEKDEFAMLFDEIADDIAVDAELENYDQIDIPDVYYDSNINLIEDQQLDDILKEMKNGKEKS